MILRPYQQRAVSETIDRLRSRPILVAPTGSGKTVAASALVRRLNRPTLWIVHRRELVHQAAETLRRYDLKTGIIMAGEKPDPGAAVQVASIQTVVRRKTPPVDLLIVDECHHATATTYTKVTDAYPGIPIVGLTATPFRLDNRGLGDIFGSIVVACHADELCADGTLIEPVVYAPDAPSMLRAPKRGGDYTTESQFRAMSKPKITGNVVKTWFQRAGEKRTIAFAVNVEHSKQIVAEFRRLGVKAEHLDGKTSRAQRDGILERLRIGYTKVVSNCQVLTEGWDLPALEVAIIARPTASLCLHLQTIGRIMRAAPDKTGALVLDHAGNHLRHGFVTQRLEYSLDGTGAASRNGGGSPGKRCPECYLLVEPGTTECPECGHAFRPEAPKHAEGELRRLDRERPSLANQQAAWDSIERQRRHFDRKEGWSFHRFKALFGFYPFVVDGVVRDPDNASISDQVVEYRRLDAIRRSRGWKPGWTAVRYKLRFGHWPTRAVREAAG